MVVRLSSSHMGGLWSQMPWRRHFQGVSEGGQEESLLGYTNEKFSGLLVNHNGSSNGRSKLSRTLLIVTVTLVIFFCWFLLPSNIVLTTSNVAATQYLHLVIPDVAAADSSLCKAVLTAQVLNYPVPIVIAGEKDSSGLTVPDSARPRHQLSETFKWLESLPLNADDGIVILLDSPGTWFQLRPEVLLQRYYSIIHRADRKLASKGSTRVVMTAQKDCVPSGETDLTCQVALSSPSAKKSLLPYPGNGAVIGPVKDLRAIFQRAMEKSDNNVLARPEDLLTEIFSEQELQRAAIREGRNWANTLREAFPKISEGSIEKRQSNETSGYTKFDFGIGLDYQGELGVSMLPGGPAEQWSQSSQLPLEVEQSMPPFWTVSGGETTLPREQGWKDLKLYTHSSAVSAPAMIHFPRTSNDSTEAPLVEQQWTSHWVQPYARTLYTAAQRLPASVIAHVEDDHGQEHIFWNKMRKAGRDKAGAWTPSGAWLYWEDLCSGEDQWKEVFRDDLGRWRRTDW